MSSAEISAQVGAFQQQQMVGIQTAGMLSGYGQSYGHSFGQQMGGQFLNQAGAVLGGVGEMASGMLSPGAMAFSGGLSGLMSGGVRGAAFGAVGGAALGTALSPVMMAGQYAAGQAMTGMQQQQQLYQSLGQTFRFPNQFGGRGFTSTEMSGVGSMFRGMASQRGPGGEQVSFNELIGLTQNMSRLGMTNNIRNIQDFQTQFKKMLGTVKEVAKAMSTSLEEAQNIMNSMKSSGIFRDQGMVANAIRATALGGNLATSEVTQAMGIGSRISRQIGGRGNAGAVAGMMAIGNVGSALQTGILNEEDIYNVTGQTGAAGRQAYAQNMLRSDAQFLMDRRKGRYFLASIAGEDGTIDQDAVNEIIYGGGTSVGRTRQLAHRNSSMAGRLNFMRHEGKLRGEALSQFGGLAKVIGYKGWLESRGLDINDDRASAYLQRRQGMGADEADQMIRMVQTLPMLMESRKAAVEQGNYSRRLGKMNANRGIAGLKKDIDKAMEKVNNGLREWGASVYDDVSNAIDGVVADITGSVFTYQPADAMRIIQSVRAGGEIGFRARQRLTGTGTNDFAAGHITSLGLSSANTMQNLKAAGDLNRFQAAGYGIDPELNEQGLRNSLWNFNKAQENYQSGFRDKTSGAFGFGSSYRSHIQAGLASGQIAGRGTDFEKSVMRYLQSSSDPELKIWGDKLEGLSPKERTLAVGGIMGGTGESALFTRMDVPGIEAVMSSVSGRTERDLNKKVGSAIFGGALYDVDKETTQRADAARPEVAARYRAANPFGVGRSSSQVSTSDIPVMTGTRAEDLEAMGSFILSSEGKKHLRGALSRDNETLQATRKELYDLNMADLGEGKLEDLDAATRSKVRARQTLYGLTFLAERQNLKPNEPLSEEDYKEAASRAGMGQNVKQFEQTVKNLSGMQNRLTSEDRKAAARIDADRARSELKGLNLRTLRAGQAGSGTVGMGGLGTGGIKVLTKEDEEAFRKAGGTAGVNALSKILTAKDLLSTADQDGDAGNLEKAYQYLHGRRVEKEDGSIEYQGGVMQDHMRMSVQQQRATAKLYRDHGLTREADALNHLAGVSGQLARGAGTTRGAYSAAKMLGVTFRGSELRKFVAGDVSVEDQAAMISEKLGFEGSDYKGSRDQVTEMVRGQRAGGVDGMAAAQNAVMALQKSGKLQEANMDKQDTEAKKNSPIYRLLEGIKTSIDQNKLKVSIEGGNVTVTNIGDLKAEKDTE